MCYLIIFDLNKLSHYFSFNTAIPTQGFIYANQFLQISSVLPSNNIYGLGEHVMGLRINTTWTRLSLFSRDIATPEVSFLTSLHGFEIFVHALPL